MELTQLSSATKPPGAGNQKQESLYYGASTLMQSTLMVKNHHQKTIEVIMEDLNQAEEMINGTYRRDQGLRLLDGVKKTLARLSGHTAKRQNGRAAVVARAF